MHIDIVFSTLFTEDAKMSDIASEFFISFRSHGPHEVSLIFLDEEVDSVEFPRLVLVVSQLLVGFYNSVELLPGQI